SWESSLLKPWPYPRTTISRARAPTASWSRHAMLRCWRGGVRQCVIAARHCELSHAGGAHSVAALAHRAAVLFVDDALLHDEAHILENPDVGEGIAVDRNDIG